jgi:hypothetical protein
MTNQHPITPSPELVKQWREAPEFFELSPCALVTVTTTKLQDIATQSAQWGADKELEACCEWLMLNGYGTAISRLRDARRPNPPSLKEQALDALENLNGECLLEGFECPEKVATIRRALESLPD